MLSFNNKLISIGGKLVNDYKEPPKPPYEYFSFKARGNGRIYFDPIGGVFKYFDNSISKDLTTGTEFPTNGGGGDWPNFNYSDYHDYQFVWSEQDLQSTFDVYLYGNNAGWDDSRDYIEEIYSLDFWHASDWFKMGNHDSFLYCKLLPQSANLIFRGESLTTCANAFTGAPIQNSIEAFILAMQQACPNLTTTSGCFANCTTAPDYNYCLTTYPNWF